MNHPRASGRCGGACRLASDNRGLSMVRRLSCFAHPNAPVLNPQATGRRNHSGLSDEDVDGVQLERCTRIASVNPSPEVLDVEPLPEQPPIADGNRSKGDRLVSALREALWEALRASVESDAHRPRHATRRPTAPSPDEPQPPRALPSSRRIRRAGGRDLESHTSRQASVPVTTPYTNTRSCARRTWPRPGNMSGSGYAMRAMAP
jgi:hypothetical protein